VSSGKCSCEGNMNIWCGVPSGDSQGHSTWWPLHK